MLREGISGHSLDDPSERCATSHILGRSMRGRVLVVPGVRLEKSTRVCRVDSTILREDIIDHVLEDLDVTWMIV